MRDAPRPPSHLSAKAARLWASMHEAYELDPHEVETLRLALEALDRANQARRALREHGLTYSDRWSQPHARPEVAIERDSRQSWLRLMGALSLPAEEEPSQLRNLRGHFAGRGRVSRAKAVGGDA
jgi:phage terminase small subunit